ncbi:hypothetical protein GBAR_LOCUS9968 [Geodia barretti]|uniref:Uncharacterized protein n=1 Tax=Geodia barretti TaxID=519541 RepID=A0AA35WJ26_GEOBA|nr:hypothetical protein GBAR_LOCUS9968 [Geodia barretti]
MSAVAEKPVDREGLPVTCTNLDALPVYNEMLLVNMAVRESALSQVQSVLELDQGFILAHCILGCMWLSELIPATDPKEPADCSTFPPVSGHVKMAKTALEGGTLTEREERHVQALLAYAEGQLPTSIDHWAAILVNYPRD